MALMMRRLRNVEQRLEALDEGAANAGALAAQRQAELTRMMRLIAPASSSMSVFWNTASEESNEEELVMSRAVSDFYIAFQNKHRGSEELIRERQRGRVQYFRSCRRVLDIGCGRGEFLDLLRDDGVPAEGIDLSETAIQACEEKGLTAHLAEAAEFLAKTEPGTYDGIHMSHVVEHIPFAQAVGLLESCAAHLPDGGVLVAETPNPHSPEALQAFFLDPTHIRPLFPEALVILLETLGFRGVKAHFVNPLGERQYGVEPAISDFADYLVVGVKAQIDLAANGEGRLPSTAKSESTVL
jgi:O-antigen chain-terminating methyltransferase